MNDWIAVDILALTKLDVNMSPFVAGPDLLFILICIRKVVKLRNRLSLKVKKKYVTAIVTKKKYSKLLIHCLEVTKPLFCLNIVIQPHWHLPLTPFIGKIRTEFLLLKADFPPFYFMDMDYIMPVCTASSDYFDIVTVEELTKIISCMNKTTCKSDPFPTNLLLSHLTSIISSILHIVNPC